MYQNSHTLNQIDDNSYYQKNIHDFIRNHRTLSFIFFFILCIAFIGVVIFLFSLATPRQKEQEPEISPRPYFEHRYLIEYSTSRQLSEEIFSDVGKVIIESEEAASAPESNAILDGVYTAELDESSYKKELNQNDVIYSVDLKISDARTYTLYIRIDENANQYAIAVLDRTDLESASDHIFIYTDSENAGEQNEIKKITNSWMKNLNLTGPMIETSPFPTA